MSRRQRLALGVLPPLVVVGAIVGGRTLFDRAPASNTTGVERADDAALFEHDYLIPLGTADRIARGERVEIVPAELVVRVGHAIRIVNDDTASHTVGAFFVAAGETLTQRFSRAGVLQGECSMHPSGAFTLRIEE